MTPEKPSITYLWTHFPCFGQSGSSEWPSEMQRPCILTGSGAVDGRQDRGVSSKVGGVVASATFTKQQSKDNVHHLRN